jgi:NAD+ kinase
MDLAALGYGPGMDVALARVGLIVHPSRDVRGAIATLEAWARRRQTELVTLTVDSPAADAAACELVVALGGDGTALAALHLAGPAGRPVLGVACGSLGALTATSASRLDAALSDVAGGRWRPRRLPGLELRRAGEQPLPAVNDVVLVRRGAGQVIVEVTVDGERFVRFAGDGLVVATPLGSSGYTLASGGPLLAPGAGGAVITPLAPHGGCCPPLVTTSAQIVGVTLEPGYGGARLELDGQPRGALEPPAPAHFELAVRPDAATVVELASGEPALAGLRRRRIVIDSPRILARDDRDGRDERDARPGSPPHGRSAPPSGGPPA